jgi:hypothetical protein
MDKCGGVVMDKCGGVVMEKSKEKKEDRYHPFVICKKCKENLALTRDEGICQFCKKRK